MKVGCLNSQSCDEALHIAGLMTFFFHTYVDLLYTELHADIHMDTMNSLNPQKEYFHESVTQIERWTYFIDAVRQTVVSQLSTVSRNKSTEARSTNNIKTKVQC